MIVSVAPEVLEARGRQLRVAHGVLDVAMAEIRLQGARVGALVGQLKAAGRLLEGAAYRGFVDAERDTAR
jgi:hypothetical protein